MAIGSASSGFRMRRIPSLDGLRALSIVLVLYGHLRGTRNFSVPSLTVAGDYANVGVRVFFVISGFLITTLLLNENTRTGKINLRAFYVRRAFRILPAAYVYMLCAVAFNWRQLSGADIAIAFSYVTNWSLHPPWILGHLWSLSVEEQFYLLWPGLLALWFRRGRRFVLFAIACGPVVRAALWLLKIPDAADSYFPAVADALATGALLAMLQPELRRLDRVIRSNWFLAVPALTLLLPLLDQHYRFYQTIGLTMLHVGIALSIQHVVVRPYSILNGRFVVWLGVISYSLYLWQQPFLDRHSAAIWSTFPINIILVFVCAVVSHHAVERPFLQAREQWRFFESRSRDGTVLPAD